MIPGEDAEPPPRRPACPLVAGAFVALGTCLRVAQFLSDRSLWLDEARLTLNLQGRGYADLLLPLDHQQTAPPLFLWIERFLIGVLGDSERALRLFPLLCGVMALVWFAPLALRVAGGWGGCLAIGLLAIADVPIYFSSMVKPYATDLAVAAGLWLLAVPAGDGLPTPRRILALAAAGCAALWMSYAALFVLGGIGAVHGAAVLRARDRGRCVAWGIAAAAWGASFLLLMTLPSAAARDAPGIAGFWEGAFLPFPPRAVADLARWGRAFVGAFHDPAGFRLPELAALAFLGGVAVLSRRRPRIAALLAAPLVLVAAASSLGRYPVEGRLLLFAVPPALLGVGVAAGALTVAPGAGALRTRAVGILLAALLAAQPAAYAARCVVRPRVKEELRPVLEDVRARWRDGDLLYVYYGAGAAFDYYAPRLGLADAPVVRGGEWRTDPAGYLREVDSLPAGRRVWAVFAHVYKGADEEGAIVSRLAARGVRDGGASAPGASAHAFRLGRFLDPPGGR